MGEVYTARDTRLDRTVAVKVLPSDVAANPERRARFEREARAVAALQHPNICTIHDVGVATDGVPFLVMELLPGETLQRRLGRGRLDDGEFVEIATALTGALDAAHTSAIIHRDIKPANIFLTGHGPKILDFGLAKAMVDHPVATASMQSTKLADGGLTGHGQTVGTVAYMSRAAARRRRRRPTDVLPRLVLTRWPQASGLGGTPARDFLPRSCTSSRRRLGRSGRRCPRGSKTSF